jgi:tRNA A37 N6-isopentenylltransferase MiaA
MSLPSASEVKIITRLLNFIEKQGASVVIMGTTVFIFYSMFQDQIKINTSNMEEMRNEIQECNDYSRDVLQNIVEQNTITMEKVIESVERLEKNNHH